MSVAKVNVIQSALVNGQWVMPGPAEMDVSDARPLAARGYLEIISVDGVEEVFIPCCDHDATSSK